MQKSLLDGRNHLKGSENLGKNIHQDTIKELTTVSNALKNPFSNLESVLDKLGTIKDAIDQNSDQKTIGSPQQMRTDLDSSAKIKNQKKDKIISKDFFSQVLTDLNSLFKGCEMCGKGTLSDELISGMCFECHTKLEFLDSEKTLVTEHNPNESLTPLLNRIGKLEEKINLIEKEYNNLNHPKKEYMSDIISEILTTLRKDLKKEISIVKNSPSNIISSINPTNQNFSVAPPPPPPSSDSSGRPTKYLQPSDIIFNDMNLKELENIPVEVLEELSISQRNLYNARIQELVKLNEMSPEEKKKYYEEREKKQKQKEKIDDFKSSLLNLSDSDNELFLKMKKRAEDSTLTGSGTLGKIHSIQKFLPCYNCGETNLVEEGSNQNQKCKKCDSLLNHR